MDPIDPYQHYRGGRNPEAVKTAGSEADQIFRDEEKVFPLGALTKDLLFCAGQVIETGLDGIKTVGNKLGHEIINIAGKVIKQGFRAIDSFGCGLVKSPIWDIYAKAFPPTYSDRLEQVNKEKGK